MLTSTMHLYIFLKNRSIVKVQLQVRWATAPCFRGKHKILLCQLLVKERIDILHVSSETNILHLLPRSNDFTHILFLKQ